MDEAEGAAAQHSALPYGPGGRFAPASAAYLPVAAQQQASRMAIGARRDAYADDDDVGPMYGGLGLGSRVIRTGGYNPRAPQRMAELVEDMRRAAAVAGRSGAGPASGEEGEAEWQAPAAGGATVARLGYDSAEPAEQVV